MRSEKTTYQSLIDGGYEFVQATPMEEGWFEIVFSKDGNDVVLKTNEPFAQQELNEDVGR